MQPMCDNVQGHSSLHISMVHAVNFEQMADSADPGPRALSSQSFWPSPWRYIF